MSNRDFDEDVKNKNFVMFTRTSIDAFTELNATSQKVLMFFIKHMDGLNALCVSMNALTEILGMSRQSISKGIKVLREEGWIDVQKTGTSNVYIINPDDFWTSYAYQKEYCEFKSNVIISRKENAEYLNNRKSTKRFKTIDESFINAVRHNKDVFEQQLEE